MHKTYTSKIVEGELVLDGVVQKAVLNNPKLFPWFTYGYAHYKPDPAAIALLKPIAPSVKVLIFAGSWCDDTKRELPAFYKVAEQAGFGPQQFEVIMVDKKKNSRFFNISVMQAANIPAFIFYRDGKEAGRIIEKCTGAMEQDIVSIFNLK